MTSVSKEFEVKIKTSTATTTTANYEVFSGVIT